MRVVAVCLTIVVYEFGHNTIRLSSRSLAALTLSLARVCFSLQNVCPKSPSTFLLLSHSLFFVGFFSVSKSICQY